MHIVHSESSCGWGGQELRILSEATGMQARGHRVTLLCPPEAKICREAPQAGIETVALPIGKKRGGGVLALRRWLAGNAVDVVNCHSSTDSWLVALACASLRRAPPVVRTRHVSATVSGNATTRWLYTRAMRHIVTTGERLRQTLIGDNGFPAAMITSVPTGIDPERFQPRDRVAARAALGLAAGRPTLGIVATLRSWKGHHHLIEACTRLRGHDWQLLVLGDGPRRGYLEEMVSRLGVGERVRFLGHRTDPEAWLPALDVFCLPSYANEGVPQALLQAMFVGLPVVTTDVGSIGEVVADGVSARVVPASDPPALAAAIAALLDDPAAARAIGEAARRTVSARYTREAMLDAMERIFVAATMAPTCA